jgi:hypothetical protein
MRVYLIALFLQFFAQSVFAEWRITESADAMTDKVSRSAMTASKEGPIFSIRRREQGDVWATFGIPDRLGEILDADLGIMFRVDKNQAVEVRKNARLERLVEKPLVLLSARWISWRIWAEKGDINRGPVRSIMEGQELLIRYFTLDGGSRDVRFDLSGAKHVIAQVLGVPPDADPVAAASENELLEVHRAMLDLCPPSMSRSQFQSCLRRNNECRKQHMRDAAALRACAGLPAP